MEASDPHVQEKPDLHVFPVPHVGDLQQEKPGLHVFPVAHVGDLQQEKPELHVSRVGENPWQGVASSSSVDSVDCLPLHLLSKAAGFTE